MKVNGFNDVFRSGATSATECQAAKQSNALITITFHLLIFFLFRPVFPPPEDKI